jgi:hypothetical protein
LIQLIQLIQIAIGPSECLDQSSFLWKGQGDESRVRVNTGKASDVLGMAAVSSNLTGKSTN